MIRPAGTNTIGVSYVEGVVSAADREKFFDFLNTSAALRNQQVATEGIPVDTAYQRIVVRRDSKKAAWHRPLPDRKAGFAELEARLWKLPLQAQRAVDLRAVRQSGWYE